MFTGALAASYYGTPRTTMDVDIVVEASSRGSRAKLASALKTAGLRGDSRRIDAALESGFRFVTFRDSKTSFAVDLILSETKLEKKAGTILGLPTFYQTPESLVLVKLRMIKATIPRERAFKDQDDIRSILRFTKVKMNSLRRLARRDNTLSVLEGIVSSAANPSLVRNSVLTL